MKHGLRRLAAIGLTACCLAIGLEIVAAGPALACVPGPNGGCYTPHTYYVSGTDGTLAVQVQPHVSNVTRLLHEGNAVQVICQINWGGTDPYDGLSSHTWDLIAGGGWVYDWYISTPAQNADGWSAGLTRCDLPAGQLSTAVPVPSLAVNAMWVASSPAQVFRDGPGYFNSTAVRGLSDGGACQDFVMANTDFWWLWDSWDGYQTLNDVFTWASISQSYGRSVYSTPGVGDIAVFAGGWHGPWNYGTGHVAMVVKVNDSSSFTVAEYNWHANGGGFGVMDFRRVAMGDFAGSYLKFIR
ncbi:MAG: CHAP domain-containing protein [Streptosporangiaceae bacterium]|nr:CHAP domain-containing protein [Streptosporangiaceae bacterium]MBV9855129.1 CHAP domain-containing protein [Streptosporangiaceae bacterium]